MKKTLIALTISLFATQVGATIVPATAGVTAGAAAVSNSAHRSAAAKAAFARQTPCPVAGGHGTSCPGYVIDHKYPLCAGGLDSPINMQWQAKGASLAKDAEERALCAQVRLHQIPWGLPAGQACHALSAERYPVIRNAVCR